MNEKTLEALPAAALMLQDYFLDFEPSLDALLRIVEDDEDLQQELEDGAVYDTMVREWLIDSYTELLLGHSWPTYGDNTSEEHQAEMLKRLEAASLAYKA